VIVWRNHDETADQALECWRSARVFADRAALATAGACPRPSRGAPRSTGLSRIIAPSGSVSAIGRQYSRERLLPGPRDRPIVLRAFVVSYLLVLFLSVFQLTVLRPWTAALGQRPIIYAGSIYGLTAISVFNQDLLPLAENFFTLTVYDYKGEKWLIPFFGESGEYLGWQNWSDRAFIADGLSWRIGMLKKTPTCYDKARDASVLANLLAYSSRFYSDRARFVLSYFHEPTHTCAEWLRMEPLTFKPTLLCTIEIDPKSGVPLMNVAAPVPGR
jgi:hypothetical protein